MYEPGIGVLPPFKIILASAVLEGCFWHITKYLTELVQCFKLELKNKVSLFLGAKIGEI